MPVTVSSSSCRQQRGSLLLPRLPMLRLAVLLLLFLMETARGVILRPFKDAQGADVAMVVLAGANVPAARYAPLGRAIQKALAPDLRLWVGIPDEDMVRARGGLAACLLACLMIPATILVVWNRSRLRRLNPTLL